MIFEEKNTFFGGLISRMQDWHPFCMTERYGASVRSKIVVLPYLRNNEYYSLSVFMVIAIDSLCHATKHLGDLIRNKG
jgi:hypothetical protein